jgi:hypothetical protein
LSVGIEAAADLVQDVKAGLARAQAVTPEVSARATSRAAC